jgi:hypothetical protein
MDRDRMRAFLGKSPDVISLKDRIALTGKWIALELYTPATIPLRLIQAIGDSPAECIRMLRERGLEPGRFELLPLKPPTDGH